MKKLIFVSIILALFSCDFKEKQLKPNELELNQKIISLGTDFKVNDGSLIKQKVPSIKTTFTLYKDKQKIAKASQKLLTIGAKIDVFDYEDVKIGSINEVLFTSFGLYSKYEILNQNNDIIAVSEKHQYFTTEFFISDLNGKPICKISRPAINIISDKWIIKFINQEFDKRLIIFIPFYKTFYDNNNN